MTDITALPLPQVPGISIRADVHSSAPDMQAITIMMYYYYFHLSDFLSQTQMYSALQEMWTMGRTALQILLVALELTVNIVV